MADGVQGRRGASHESSARIVMLGVGRHASPFGSKHGTGGGGGYRGVGAVPAFGPEGEGGML